MTSFLDIDLLSWQLDGSCIENKELFDSVDFSGTGRYVGRVNKERLTQAKQVCFSCPVRERCYTEAMKEERYDNLAGRTGIRGGLTARERMTEAIKLKACARCGRPNSSNPQSLAHAHVTCSACSTLINQDIDERYFGLTFQDY